MATLLRDPRAWATLGGLLQLIAVLGLLGPENLLGDRPVVDYDLGMHFYRAAALRESGGFPGLVWDPAYMAGYPLGGATDVDNRLGELGVWLLRLLPPGAAWNWTLAVLFVLVPFLPYLAARWLGADRWTANLAALLGAALFWSNRLVWPEFLDWGMYGWVVASAATPLMFAGFLNVLERPGVGTALRCGVATAFAAWAHNLTGLLVPILGVVLLGRLGRIGRRETLVLVGSVAVALLLVLPIAVPVLATLGSADEGRAGLAVYFQASSTQLYEFLSEPDRALQQALLILALTAVLLPAVERPHRELALSALGLAGLALFAFLLPVLAPLQPLRFLMPALFLAVLPAALVLRAGLRRPAIVERAALTALLAALLVPYGFEGLETLRGRRSYTTRPSAQASALIDHLRENTSASARVLMEDDGDLFGGNHFGKPHLVGYLAREIDRELIGGPHPVTLTRVGSSTFVNGVLLGRPVEGFGDDELRELLGAYNIGTVVTWSEASRQRFERLAFSHRTLAGGFTIFETGLATGFATGAPGVQARAGYDEIHVWNADGPSTILRWQYDPRFRTEPLLPIGPAPSPFSRVGFVRVENGDRREFRVVFEDGPLGSRR